MKIPKGSVLKIDRQLQLEAPLLYEAMRRVGEIRASAHWDMGANATTVELWFKPDVWREFMRLLSDYPDLGVISRDGERYGAVFCGAECFCHQRVPADDELFTIRLRFDR